jgi:hypothetical protein
MVVTAVEDPAFVTVVEVALVTVAVAVAVAVTTTDPVPVLVACIDPSAASCAWYWAWSAAVLSFCEHEEPSTPARIRIAGNIDSFVMIAFISPL